jgi:hypothetical protein
MGEVIKDPTDEMIENAFPLKKGMVLGHCRECGEAVKVAEKIEHMKKHIAPVGGVTQPAEPEGGQKKKRSSVVLDKVDISQLPTRASNSTANVIIATISDLRHTRTPYDDSREEEMEYLIGDQLVAGSHLKCYVAQFLKE